MSELFALRETHLRALGSLPAEIAATGRQPREQPTSCSLCQARTWNVEGLCDDHLGDAS